MDNKKRTIFLTGTTGLIGSYLLKVLLQNGYRVYALARSKNGKSAKDRAIDILKFWDEKVSTKYLNSLAVLEGDITKENLGLDRKSKDLLKNEVEEIFHCAALTMFNLPLEEIRKVNVEGAKNVLDFALECRNLKKVNHISTAYVCGDYKGKFCEDDLDVGQKFNSTYEQTKFEAEKLVRYYREKDLWIDIFRPPLVMGESQTGKTSTFFHFYQFLQLWNLEIFDTFPGRGAFINMVCVDTLCQSIIAVSVWSTLRNATYHVFSNKPFSFERAVELASNFVGFKKPYLVYCSEFKIDGFTPVQKAIIKNSISFLNFDIRLNSEATNLTLKKFAFTFPEFSKERFLKMLEYALKVRFLKKID
jgi:thioester reductase-like protein